MKTTFEKEESYTGTTKILALTVLSQLFSKFRHNNVTFTSFENNFVIVLNQQAPKKSEVFRGNQKPHLNKSLRSAIMKCSRLKNVLNCYFDSVTDSLDLFLVPLKLIIKILMHFKIF